MLTTANLFSIFVLQKLAAVLAEKEQMKASQGALLRQVTYCIILLHLRVACVSFGCMGCLLIGTCYSACQGRCLRTGL